MHCRNLISAALAGCLVLAGGLSAYGQSATARVKIYSADGVLHGSVNSASRDEVSFMQAKTNQMPATSKTLAVNDIEWISFSAEPADMREAHSAAEKGDYVEALKRLAKVAPNQVTGLPDLVAEEFEYLKAFYATRQAITGQSDPDGPAQNPVDVAKNAFQGLKKFLTDHPQTMHYYEANEALGDLLVSIGKYDAAMPYYTTLAESPWADYRARADLLRGRALQQAAKYSDALAAFDAVIRAAASGPLGERQTAEATIARTYSLAGAGKAEEAIKILNDVIANADEKETQRLAQAYNALGNCYRKLNDNKQALWAYLHVNVQYSSVPDAHAEALANLIPLWTEAHMPERATAARLSLQAHYPLSRWNRHTR